MKNLHAITAPQELNLLVAFFDLTGFLRYCQTHTEHELVEMLSAYYEFVGDIAGEAGGAVIKYIGDAGLLVFPEEGVNRGVLALKRLKDAGDVWLADHEVPCRNIIKAHFGPVVCARVGTRSEKQLDVFGMTVNTAAILESHGLTITPQVFRKLDASARKRFKKHTPPVTYIPVDEPHKH